MKRTPLLVPLLLVALLLSAPVMAERIDGVAVVVNGEVVTLGELEESAGPALPPASAGGEAVRQRERLLRRAADDAVSRKLLEKEAEAQGALPTALEIDEAIDNVKRTNNLDTATLEKALAQQGLTLDGYREMLKGQLTRMKLVETKVKPRVSVSEDDVRARYARMTEGLAAKKEWHVRDLFLPVDGNGPAIRARLEAARRDLVAGKSFAEVAKKVGGPLAETDGDLGWVAEGTMLPEVEEVAFALQPGEPSPVFEAGAGMHVVVVEGVRTTGGPRPLAESREEIRQQLLAERLEKATDDYLASLRKTADVDLRLR
jgi:peptidyl-prolyl cis-trans isomerase SurA